MPSAGYGWGVNRQALAAIGLGLFGVACATGTFSNETPGTTSVEVTRAETVGDSELRGIVYNRDNGAPLPNTLVVLTCTCLSAVRETQTNDNGLYRFKDLPPGEYTVQLLAGRGDVTVQLKIDKGARAMLRTKLDPSEPNIVT